MSWEVRVSKKVRRRIQRLPPKERGRVFAVFRELQMDPWSGNIEKIQGKDDLWRRRMGNYRIFYSPRAMGRFVEIKNVERRTSSMY